MRRTRAWKVALTSTALTAFGLAAFFAGRAFAGGIPASGALTYSGTLEDATGKPLIGSHNIQVNFWSAASGGATPVCLTTSASIALDNGRFTVALPDTCTTAVKASPDVWAEVLVDGASLGRTKIGAVPYAVEADRASGAAGALLQQIVPSGSVVAFNLSACPSGWSAFSAAGGRTVVGVNPSGGNGLSQRNLGATVGEETHAMTVNEMPAHAHGVTDNGHMHTVGPQTSNGPGNLTQLDSAGNCGLTCTNPNVIINALPQTTDPAFTKIAIQSAGGGNAFNQMQPSVALLYCQKN